VALAIHHCVGDSGFSDGLGAVSVSGWASSGPQTGHKRAKSEGRQTDGIPRFPDVEAGSKLQRKDSTRWLQWQIAAGPSSTRFCLTQAGLDDLRHYNLPL
jgi:hypothetical protein